MMKVWLLYPDRDYDFTRPLPPQAEDLERDLALNVLFRAMAQGGQFLFDVARHVVLCGTDDTEVIAYRQAVLDDCLKHADVVEQLYRIPLEFLERKRRHWLWVSRRNTSPTLILSTARHLLEASLDLLRTLRQIADQHAWAFTSQGFQRFFAMVQRELDDQYLALVEKHVKALRFPKGVLLRAQLGRGNEGTGYLLCKPNAPDGGWLQRLFSSSPVYTYSLHPRDEAGARILGELRDRGLVRVADAVAQAAQHVENFFNVLRRELAFYVGCLNLHRQLVTLGLPITFPRPVPADQRCFTCRGLYDPSLALTMGQPVVGNDISADGKDLFLITGPNRGGKTTFLRSVGVAHLMMQSGMFVAAESFTANVSTGIFTHFPRGEDETMRSGKFEEELKRMSAMLHHLRPHALVLFNESFAATNEREGSEVARQIVTALVEKRIKVFYVTHLYEFSRHFYTQHRDAVMSLQAERLPDSTRTFRLRVAPPLETSYGEDLYRKIFGNLEKDVLHRDKSGVDEEVRQ